MIEHESKYLESAMKIALRHDITVYDSLYIAQAQKLGEILISDESQTNIASQLKIKVHLIR